MRYEVGLSHHLIATYQNSRVFSSVFIRLINRFTDLLYQIYIDLYPTSSVTISDVAFPLSPIDLVTTF